MISIISPHHLIEKCPANNALFRKVSGLTVFVLDMRDGLCNHIVNLGKQTSCTSCWWRQSFWVNVSFFLRRLSLPNMLVLILDQRSLGPVKEKKTLVHLKKNSMWCKEATKIKERFMNCLTHQWDPLFSVVLWYSQGPCVTN